METTLKVQAVKAEKITLPTVYNHPDDDSIICELTIITNLPPVGMVIACWRKDGQPLGNRRVTNIMFSLDLDTILSEFFLQNPQIRETYNAVELDYDDIKEEHQELLMLFVFAKYPYVAGKIEEPDEEFRIPLITIDEFYDYEDDDRVTITQISKEDENRAEYFAIIPALSLTPCGGVSERGGE